MIKLPTTTEPSALADWIEASVVFSRGRRLSNSEVLDALEEGGHADPEEIASSFRRQIEIRSAYTGKAYPIEVHKRGYQAKGHWADYLCYNFMLLTSLNLHYPDLRFKRGTATKCAELFELVSRLAVQLYCSGQAIRVGAPRRKPVPAGFSLAVEHMVNALGEERGNDKVTTGHEKDDGLDIVGWIPFLDRRPGQLILIMQCAIGTDWDEKLTELNGDLWARHVHWHVAPIRAFAVPFHHNEDVPWRRSSAVGGIIFDRLRVASSIGNQELDPDLVKTIKKWCQSRIARLPRYN
jgi:hypothetical protein